MPSENRKLCAILLSDMAGYTTMMDADEARTLALLQEHDALMKPLIAQYGGQVVKALGDGFLCTFESAVHAVQCAVDMQRLLHERNERRDPSGRLLIRICVHVGDVVLTGQDAFGGGINVASRLLPYTSPGGICISESVWDHIHNIVKLDVVDLGARTLKHVARPLRLYHVPTAAAPAPAAAPSRGGRLSRGAVWAVGAGLALLGLAAATRPYWNPRPVPASAEAALSALFADLLPPADARAFDKKVVAVLAFADRTNDPDLRAAKIGHIVADAVTGALHRFQGVQLVSRAHVEELLLQRGRAFDETAADASLALDTARRAAAHAAVWGVVSRLDDTYRIHAEMYDVETRAPIQTLEIKGRGAKSILNDMIEEFSRRIMQIAVTTYGQIAKPDAVDDADAGRAVPTRSLDAYRYYMEATAFHDRGRFEEAIGLFERCVEYDPDFAIAHSHLSNAFGFRAGALSGRAREAALTRMDAHAARAVALLPRVANPKDRRWILAQRAWGEAVRSPDPAKLERVRVELEAFVRQSPGDRDGSFALGRYHHWLARDGQAALREYARTIRLTPTYFPVYLSLAQLYDGVIPDPRKARAVLDTYLTIVGPSHPDAAHARRLKDALTRGEKIA